jgi:DNA polymerase beta
MNYHDIIKFNFEALLQKSKADKQPFKVKAYATVLKNLPDEITSIEDVKGLGGAKSQDKFKYIIENNENLEEVNNILSNSSINIINELTKVHGIGPSKAKELYDKHGVKSIDDLTDDMLNDVQKIGLKYYKDIEKKIPRKEMLKHEEFLNKIIKVNYQITGSFRRKKKESGDIDVLITGEKNNLQEIIDELIKKKYIPKDGIFANGSKKFMGVVKLPRHKTYRRLDMIYTTPEEYPFALLYFTGSQKLNIEMRDLAKQKNLRLNQYGLYRDEQLTDRVEHEFNDERDIFEYLEMDYLDPEDR